jgi:hypothetical protein
MKRTDGSFTLNISVCYRRSSPSISLDNPTGGLARSVRYHPLMLSTAIDVRPRNKGRKGTRESHPYYLLVSRLSRAKWQKAQRGGRHTTLER